AHDVRTRGHLLRELGVLHHGARRMAEARDGYERALACHREAGDAHGEAITVGNLGALDHDACRYEDAEVRYEIALAGLRAVPDAASEALCQARLGAVRAALGDLGAAEEAFDRAERVAAPIRDPLASGVVAVFRAFLDRARGDDAAVERRIGQAGRARELS